MNGRLRGKLGTRQSVSSVPVRAEPSHLLFGNWRLQTGLSRCSFQKRRVPITIGLHRAELPTYLQRRLFGQLPGLCGLPHWLSVHSEARSRSRAKASASLTRFIVPTESRPILRSRRTVGRDPNP